MKEKVPLWLAQFAQKCPVSDEGENSQEAFPKLLQMVRIYVNAKGGKDERPTMTISSTSSNPSSLTADP